MDTALETEIRLRAYEIWMSSGMNEGKAEAHWLDAERAVCTEAEAAAIAAAAPVKVKAKPAKAVSEASKTDGVKTKEAKVKRAVKATAAPRRRPTAGPLEAVV